MTERYVRVARRTEVPPGTARIVTVGDVSLALCNVNGEFYAIENVCTHDGGPLGAGELQGYEIECPRHGARFDVRTGAVLCLPAVLPVRAYPVRIQGDDVEVLLEET